MSMKYDTAKKIFDCSQRCMSELNEMLRDVQKDISSEEFGRLKLSVAQSLGSLVDLCEEHVYADHPEIRPYKLG